MISAIYAYIGDCRYNICLFRRSCILVLFMYCTINIYTKLHETSIISFTLPAGYQQQSQQYRGEYRGGRGQRGSPRGRQPTNRPQREPLKFEGDFDFESSNAQFDKDQIEKELKQKLSLSKPICIMYIVIRIT